MLLFIGGAGSRLGNQIFQYAFLKSKAKGNEKIVVSGFDDFLEIFEIFDISNISQKKKVIKTIVLKVIKPVLDFLSNLKLISFFEVDYEFVNGFRREHITYKYGSGVIKSVRYVKFGFFQSEVFFDEKIVANLRIKPYFIGQADRFFEDIPKDSLKIFVHIRRGDYKDITILGKSALLPIEYYKNLVEHFNDNFNNCYFIFLSDEPEYIENEFKYLTNKKIAKDSKPGTDFVIITKCNNGILSTSTFGWWAAFLIKNKGTIFAPKYWLGFNSKIEFPEKGFPSYAVEIEI